MSEKYRRRWAVVVGVCDYGDPARTLLPGLVNAVNDACRVYHVLSNQFGVTSQLLAHPEAVVLADQRLYAGQAGLRQQVKACGTEGEILEAFDRVVAEGAKPDDLFVFFYSGHGSGESPGYLLPYGAEVGRPSTYLMYERIWFALESVPCRDKLLLLNCCYSGLATVGARGADSNLTTRRTGDPGRKVILCATDALTRTPEDFKSYTNANGRSHHSPFVEALASRLEKVMPGETISSKTLFDHILDQVTNVLLPAAVTNPATGKSFSVVPTRWPNDLDFGLRRPGIAIQVASDSFVRKPSGRQLQLEASGGQPPYIWTLEEAPSNGIRLQQNVLILDGKTLNVGEHRYTLRVTDAQRVTERQTFSLQVLPAEFRPLVIATARLNPCLVGEDYQCALQVEGGEPPYDWDATNLPAGLFCDFLDLTIWGSVPPNSRSGAEHLVRLKVTGKRGPAAERTLRLPLVDPEHYCEIPAGAAFLGYQPTPERIGELDRLGLREQVSRRTQAGFPPGEAYLPRFFIKRHPVTNQEWWDFVETKKHPARPRRWSAPDFDMKREGDLPVTDISYQDMLAYCHWRGTRLPSGWEWEKAARGVDGRLFPWGDEFNLNYCNGPELQWGQLTMVHQFPEGASSCGALDMAGNAWECVRQFQESHGEWRPVLRGGSFSDGGIDLLACTGKIAPREWRFELDSTKGRLIPVAPVADPRIGFRDVIEVADAPTYPQGLVALAASQFVVPGTSIEVSTPEVFLARYSVSNEEYREFTDSTRRSRPPHWRPHGDEPFPFADRYLPVTNVSFADAEAFCRWNSSLLGVECKVMTLRIWRAAVFGPGMEPNGFIPHSFPWGDEYSPYRCNGRDAGWGGPMHVFDLSEGCGLSGAYHLVGNVAQWIGPGQAVGGSWHQDIRNPAHWVENIAAAETKYRCDIGFRYYCQRLVGENRDGNA